MCSGNHWLKCSVVIVSAICCFVVDSLVQLLKNKSPLLPISLQVSSGLRCRLLHLTQKSCLLTPYRRRSVCRALPKFLCYSYASSLTALGPFGWQLFDQMVHPIVLSDFVGGQVCCYCNKKKHNIIIVYVPWQFGHVGYFGSIFCCLQFFPFLLLLPSTFFLFLLFLGTAPGLPFFRLSSDFGCFALLGCQKTSRPCLFPSDDPTQEETQPWLEVCSSQMTHHKIKPS